MEGVGNKRLMVYVETGRMGAWVSSLLKPPEKTAANSEIDRSSVLCDADLRLFISCMSSFCVVSGMN